jgi:glycosyltransferase involved in cell wall biosynthesis
MDDVTVSAILPCFNAAATIEPTVRSILAQTLAELEVVAVDDGSADETGDILRRLAATDRRLVVIQQANAGQAAARNRAVAASRGRYLAFIDADDLWAPSKLVRQLALIEARPEVALCYTSGYMIDDAGAVLGAIDVSPAYRGRCLRRLIRRNNIVASSVMLRRAAFERAGGFDERLRACENWDLWIRVAREGELDYLAEPLTFYRVHDGNMTKSTARMRDNSLLMLDKVSRSLGGEVGGLEAMIREAKSIAYYKSGNAFLVKFEMASARSDLWRSLRLDWGRREAYVPFLKSLMGKPLYRALRRVKHRSDHPPGSRALPGSLGAEIPPQ